MLAHTRINTGYDVEVNFGADFLLKLIQALYDTGKVKNEVALSGLVLKIGRPSRLDILTEGDQDHVELAFPLRSSVSDSNVNVGIRFHLSITELPNRKLAVRYSNLSQQTAAHIKLLGDLVGVSNLPEIVHERLTESLVFEENLDKLTMFKSVIPPQVRPLKAALDYQVSFGLYANLLPDSSTVDIHSASTLLPNDRSFAIGMAAETVSRIEAHYRPQIIGKEGVKSFELRLNEGFVEVLLEGKKSIPVLSDVNWSATIKLAPVVRGGTLSIDVSVDADADTGILTKLLGGALGFFLNPLLVGAIGGIATVELTELIGANIGELRAEGSLNSILLDLFVHIPYQIWLYSDDPTFAVYIKNSFQDVSVNAQGISIAGQSAFKERRTPVLDKCSELRSTLSDLEGGIEAWQEELHSVAPHQKPQVLQSIKEANEAIKAVKQEMRQHGCGPK